MQRPASTDKCAERPGSNDASRDAGGKDVFIVRHAESKNNVAKRESKHAIKEMKRGKGVSGKQLGYMASLVTCPMDTELSEEGEHQITIQRNRVQPERFLRDNAVELVIHSPLKRAQRCGPGMYWNG